MYEILITNNSTIRFVDQNSSSVMKFRNFYSLIFFHAGTHIDFDKENGYIPGYIFSTVSRKLQITTSFIDIPPSNLVTSINLTSGPGVCNQEKGKKAAKSNQCRVHVVGLVILQSSNSNPAKEVSPNPLFSSFFQGANDTCLATNRSFRSRFDLVSV